MFERKSDPLLNNDAFLIRLIKSFGVTILIVAASLMLGSAGYHYFGKNMSWVDAMLNAAMILTGMGPVDRMETDGGKLFATFYALYSGIAFLSMIAVTLAPLLHRLLHHFHLDEGD